MSEAHSGLAAFQHQTNLESQCGEESLSLAFSTLQAKHLAFETLGLARFALSHAWPSSEALLTLRFCLVPLSC